MRLVLGVSLTASSAVWVLVDTVNGKILADEVVALDSLQEIARATARSVQAFDVQTEHDIEGVRMTWSDDARQHGIRLRTKLRLFGFETVETVTQDAARDGRNKTARHLAPHLALAYGAARSDVNADESRGMFHRLASRVPMGSSKVPMGAAAAVFVAAVVGVGLYAFVVASPTPDAPETAAAESVPARSGQQAGPAPAAVPSAAPVAAPAAAPVAAPAVETPEALPASQPITESITEYIVEPVAEPMDLSEPVAAWQPAVEPESVPVPEDATHFAVDSIGPDTLSTGLGQPHLPVAVPAAGPVEAPVTVAPQPVTAPLPLPPPLSNLFDALP